MAHLVLLGAYPIQQGLPTDPRHVGCSLQGVEGFEGQELYPCYWDSLSPALNAKLTEDALALGAEVEQPQSRASDVE